MKRSYIIILVVLAVSVGVILALSADLTTYEDFDSAQDMEGKEVKVVGELAKDMEMVYDPENPNFFSFFMVDEEGTQMQVVYLDSKPQDFERSEQIVVTGAYKDGVFHASDILTKCPSKYTDEEIKLKEKEAV
jgi:cytochrome c-type biogenesis protein CcmE